MEQNRLAIAKSLLEQVIDQVYNNPASSMDQTEFTDMMEFIRSVSYYAETEEGKKMGIADICDRAAKAVTTLYAMTVYSKAKAEGRF